MEVLSISYFRNILKDNVKSLEKSCKDWQRIADVDDIPEEIQDEIRTVIGVTNLLLRQKLKQFKGLIDDSESRKSEKEITCLDLQGFWDMVFVEVEKIQNRFKKLEAVRKNKWVEVSEKTSSPRPKKKQPAPPIKKPVATSGHAEAARQRLAEAKLKMKQQMMQHKTASETEGAIIVSANLKERVNTQEIEAESAKPEKKSEPVVKSKRGRRAKDNKENVIVAPKEIVEPAPIGKKRRNKPNELIPLAAVTRSMAAKQKCP